MAQESKRPLARCHTVPFEGLARAPAEQQRTPTRTVPFERPPRPRAPVAPRLVEVPILGREIGGRYTIEELVGEGPTGSVYRARQRALDKHVAIKILNAEHAAAPGCVERLHRAARAASLLDHGNIAHVLDYGREPDGLLYVVMEYVAARDLRTILEDDRALDPRRAAHVARQILAALAVAHDHHLVHGDLKPENILVSSGAGDDGEPVDVVKVTDFGLFAGSPEYSSPEQFRGAVLEPRSDLYSVGVLLYQMLTGEKPFVGESAVAVAMQHAADPVFPPSHLADVPASLDAICLRALEKLPRNRFGSAREMRRALGLAIDAPKTPSERPEEPAEVASQAPAARAPQEPVARTRQRRAWPAVVALGAAAAFAVLSAGAPTPTQRHALGIELHAAPMTPPPSKGTAEPNATPRPDPKFTSLPEH